MNPFFFGTRERRLFGIYTPGRGAGTRAAVLCHPFGQEYVRAHRSMRQLGIMLNHAGFHVLRFDYFGTGDSGGDMTDADLKGWHGDIGMAIDELRDTCGASRVTLIGMRLGGSLAAGVAAARRRDVEALVLWDAVLSGSRYVARLLDDSDPSRASFERPIPRPPEAGGGHEVMGFPLTSAMAAEIAGVDVARMAASWPKRTLVMTSGASAVNEARAAFEGAAQVELRHVESEPAWIKDDDGPGAMPVKLLQDIVQWVS
jgi:pimeloyl-ACP methyl ester carboxylesterase